MKRAFLFPGQGAQIVGMGKDIYENYQEARKIYDKATETSGMDIKKLCFEGPEEDLNKTENTQIAILTTSLAILEVLKARKIEADIAVGLSLGEYTALIYSGIHFIIVLSKSNINFFINYVTSKQNALYRALYLKLFFSFYFFF